MAPASFNTSGNSKDECADLETSNNYDNASTVGIIKANKSGKGLHSGSNNKNKTKLLTRVVCSACGVATILVFYIFCGAIVFLSLENVSKAKSSKNSPYSFDPSIFLKWSFPTLTDFGSFGLKDFFGGVML